MTTLCAPSTFCEPSIILSSGFIVVDKVAVILDKVAVILEKVHKIFFRKPSKPICHYELEFRSLNSKAVIADDLHPVPALIYG